MSAANDESSREAATSTAGLCAAIANHLRQLAPHVRKREAARLLADALAAIAERDEALHYLMQQFDAETWQCPTCGHAEDTATMDSACWLRDWLAVHNAGIQPSERSEDRLE